MSHVPSVTIYTFDKKLTQENIQAVDNIANRLIEKGIPKSNISVHPLFNDRELAKLIIEQAGDASWPIVFIDGSPIIDLDEWIIEQPKFSTSRITESNISSGLYTSLDANDILFSGLNSSSDFDSSSLTENLVDEEENSRTSLPQSEPVQIANSQEDLSLGYMGQTLEGLERGVVGFSSYMRSALDMVGLSPKEEGIEKYFESDNDLSTRTVLVEFQVIQSNWYYRQQTRVLRCYSNCFVRVNPLTNEIRSVHSYADISKISVIENNWFTIDYVDDSPQESYQSLSAGEIIKYLASNSSKMGGEFVIETKAIHQA